MIAAEISLGAVRRKRIAAPMLRDENLDLTINELTRIRGREPAGLVKPLPTRPAVAAKATRARPSAARGKARKAAPRR